MACCKVHNVKFYKPKPKAIYCMAPNRSKKKLALSRSDATIEIWDSSHCAFIERSIASSIDNYSIEGLAWYNNRLFSVGLHGFLVEYDLHRLSIRNKSIVTGEAAFCLDIHTAKNQVAVGTELGYLNIFDITEDGTMFNKFLDKQEGRILCIKYDSAGDFIVSGSLDAIRVWDAESGHAIHKMTTGRSEMKKATIVWCIAVTNDFTIISGDSRGKLSFWDGKMGSQIESYQSHRADILSLCLSDDQTSLFCAGIDPNITNYVKIKVKDSNEKWVKSVHRKIHDHDVRSLVLNENKLYSGGIDGYLACSYHPPKTLLKYPPVLQSPCVTISKKGRMLMLRFPKYIEIWSMGEVEDVDSSQGYLPLLSEPKKLLVLKRTVKNHNGQEKKEGIIFSSISDDGKWIVYGTKFGLRLFQLEWDGVSEIPKLFRVENVGANDEKYITAIFGKDCSQLIAAVSGGRMHVFNVSTGAACVTQKIETSEIHDTITFLITSKNGKYLIAADPSSNIVVWTSKNKIWHFYCKLPVYSCSPTSMALHPILDTLVIVYSDSKIIEYDITRREFTDFSRNLEHRLPKSWSSRSYPIRNISFDPNEKDIILLYDDSNIIVINKNKMTEDAEDKIPRIDTGELNESDHVQKTYAFRSIKKYRHLVHLDWLSNDEMVAVEINPLGLLEQLPPSLIRNKFGTK